MEELRDALFELIMAARADLATASEELADGLNALLGEMVPKVIVALMIEERVEVRRLRASLEAGPSIFLHFGALGTSNALAKLLRLLGQWLGDQPSTLH